MKKKSLFVTVKYLSHFVARAFLIAIICFLTLFGLVLFAYMGDLVLNMKNGTLKNPLFSAYVIVSPSMVPTIQINDAIVVKRIDYDKYNIGDIITFSSSDINYEGLAVTHRIVNKERYSSDESIYTTKGDNNNIVDPATVKTSSIYGRVVLKIPSIGYARDFFSTPWHFFACLLIPTVLIIIYDLIRIFYMMRQKRSF